MKTIAINSIKGGTGKSTLSVLLVNALTGAGYKASCWMRMQATTHSRFILTNQLPATPLL
jgi:hypothetical protein